MWFVLRIARFKAEFDDIATLESLEPWLQNVRWRFDPDQPGVACVDADLVVRDVLRPVTLAYPPIFPFAPPSVMPREATERWSGHQYGAVGELCLEHRADNWVSTITGADMLRSAYRLLFDEGALDATGKTVAVPSAHRVTLGQSIRAESFRFVATAALLERLLSVPTALPATFHFNYGERSIAAFLTKLSLTEGGDWVDSELPAAFKKWNFQDGFALGLLAGDPRLESLPKAVKAGAHALREWILDGRDVPFTESQTLLVGSPTGIRAFYADPKDDAVSEYFVILPKPGDRLPGANIVLASKKVVIVGAGSLGGKVAVSLTRAGVRDFLLIDDDIMQPENLLRHDLDWESVGLHKVDALAARLKLIASTVKVDARRQRLGGQEASKSLHSVLSAMAQCDLIVDATGDDAAFNFSASVAEQNEKPMAWARVFGGGYGGIIARSRPGREPSPQLARSVVERWCSNPDFPDAPRALVNYEAVDSHEQPMIADDGDVSAIASQFTRMVIDTLVDPTESAFANSAYMIGLRKEWIFAGAFDTWPIDLGMPPSSNGGQQLSEAEQEVAVGLLLEMAKTSDKIKE